MWYYFVSLLITIPRPSRIKPPIAKPFIIAKIITNILSIIAICVSSDGATKVSPARTASSTMFETEGLVTFTIPTTKLSSTKIPVTSVMSTISFFTSVGSVYCHLVYLVYPPVTMIFSLQSISTLHKVQLLTIPQLSM